MNDVLYQLNIIKLNQKLKALSLEGVDTGDFLHRQLTSDVKGLTNGTFQLSARLDNGGRVKAFFYVLKKSNEEFYIICDESKIEFLKSEFDKFIIMEDIKINDVPKKINSYISLIKETPLNSFRGILLNCPGFFSFDEIPGANCITVEELANLFTLTAWPRLSDETLIDNLINDSRLNELAVSYKKGCFLGQETISKIQTRRGAAKYPAWIVSKNDLNESEFKEINSFVYKSKCSYEDKYFYLVDLPRAQRVEGMAINDNKNFVVNLNAPFNFDLEKIAEELYLYAIKKSHAGQVELALKIIDECIKYEPSNPDYYEVKGVILGQSGNFEEAIKIMDQLLTIDSNSVMAHTNKSLYFMKLGKIEEAEEEKSLATVASFQKFGEEAKVKKEIEEQKKREEAELLKREKMFVQVLEIDPEDDIATYGLADISFRKNEIETCLTLVNKLLLIKPKYSQAYLLKGKALEIKGDIHQAKEIYQAGIKIAATQGEMMPANEMQARLNKIGN